MPLIKLSNNAIKNVTSLPISVGTMNLISSQTASNSASISFTTGINSTYKEYQFWFVDIHCRASGNPFFQFNMSTDGGSNYNVTKTTTFFRAYHAENDSATSLEYVTSQDLAQSTSATYISDSNANGADENACGSLQLFNPSSTIYVKHFIARVNSYPSTYSMDAFTAGYGNTTSAINAVQFSMTSGNFDGTIAMYGIS